MLTQQTDPEKFSSIQIDCLGEPWEAMRVVPAKFHWEAWQRWVWYVWNLTPNPNQPSCICFSSEGKVLKPHCEAKNGANKEFPHAVWMPDLFKFLNSDLEEVSINQP